MSTPIGVTKTLSASDGIEEPTLARALKAPESIAQLSLPMTERNPYAPPQAEVRDAPAALPTKGSLATRTLRLAGGIVDSVALAVFVVPFLLFTGDWTAAISGELSYGTISLVGFASFTAMQGYLLATRGQTIGKWLVGTRIVRADNDEVPTLARTLGLRYGTLALGLAVTLSVLVLTGVIPYVLRRVRVDRHRAHFPARPTVFARPDRRHEGRRRRAAN